MRSIRLLVATAVAVLASVAGFAPAQAVTAYSVSISLSKTSVDSGSSITISGNVTPGNVSGKTVTVYWKRYSEDDSWHKIGTATLNSSGHYSKSFKPTEGGDVYFRVIKAASSSHSKGIGVSSYVPVYQWDSAFESWYYGVDDEANSGGYKPTMKTVTLNGHKYKNALLIYDGSLAFYATEQCKAIRGVVRVPTSSVETAGSLGIDQGSSYLGYEPADTNNPNKFSVPLDPDNPTNLTGHQGGAGDNLSKLVVTALQVDCDAPA